MIELGQLERRQADFARRHVRVIAVSVEGTQDAALTQSDFPHLTAVADEGRGLSDAVGLIHPNSGPAGSDTSAPTTILIDRHGVVRWLFRSGAVNVRLSPDDVLDAVDTHLSSKS
jgi:peroxiredoxin